MELVIGMISGMLISAAIVGILVYLLIHTWKKQSNAEDQSSLYFVRFKGIQKPELANNDAFKQVAEIMATKGDTYQVQSKINDGQLKAMIMEEFQLNPSQVIVFRPYLFLPRIA